MLAKDSVAISPEDLAVCGANYCPSPTSEAASNRSINNKDVGPEMTVNDNFSISDGNLYTLASIYLVCSLVSIVIVSVFVDPLKR